MVKIIFENNFPFQGIDIDRQEIDRDQRKVLEVTQDALETIGTTPWKRI